QGKLENSSGDVVTGTHNFNFSLYTVSTGGSAEWTEEQTGVSVDADGIYDVILGSVDAINLDFDEAYYLGVEVDGDGEMTPRINLTSTPYAQRAKFADTVECSDCIDSTEILNYSILPKDLDNLSGIADEDILTYESTGGVFEWHTPAELITAGDSLSWSSSTLNVADDWYDSVNDIPNATPADGVQSFSTANQIYDYIDGLGLSGAYTAGDGLTLTGSQFNVSDGGIDGTQLADTIILDANLAITQADFDVNFDANTLFVDGTESRVGIGTITPGEKLYVDGNINVTVGNDICIEGDKCLSEASVAGGDITAVNTAEKYLTGGDTTGAISLLLNETELNSTIDARDSGDTTYTAGNGLSLGGTEFTVDAHTAITVDASGVSVTADSIDGTQLSDEITLDADLSLNGGGSYDVNISGVYIDSDGQLGLGTIPSSRALDVVGNSRFNGGVDFSGGNVNIIENLSVGQNINLTGDLFVNGDDIGLYDGQINTDNGPIGVDSCGYGSTSLGMCTESGVITLGYSGPKLYLKSGGIGISYDDGFSGGNDPDTELHIDGGVCIDNNAVCTDPGDGNLNVVGNINIKGDFTGLGIGNFTGNVYAANFSSHSPLRLQTEGTTRIYVGDNKGYVGINTENPKGLLHVQDGSLLFNGTSGATPTSGAGTRMMWIPEKAAFRAGEVTATEWDAANVGAYSFAGGYRTKASGGSSTAFG
ncbi:MAG: hypothetical protein KAQ83_04410, partial [Nanoarchaeota archaeon]|nr:hypothetical protein [Nanoarchaeota archaeon]